MSKHEAPEVSAVWAAMEVGFQQAHDERIKKDYIGRHRAGDHVVSVFLNLGDSYAQFRKNK